jgi:hypothetical protein
LPVALLPLPAPARNKDEIVFPEGGSPPAEQTLNGLVPTLQGLKQTGT